MYIVLNLINTDIHYELRLSLNPLIHLPNLNTRMKYN